MAKIGHFWPKSRKREFFSKIRLEHFFSIIKIQLCAKNHQNLMRGFLDIAPRTDARTSVNPLALIGVAERAKMILDHLRPERSEVVFLGSGVKIVLAALGP